VKTGSRKDRIELRYSDRGAGVSVAGDGVGRGVGALDGGRGGERVVVSVGAVHAAGEVSDDELHESGHSVGAGVAARAEAA
jgi:hypothetical protein